MIGGMLEPQVAGWSIEQVIDTVRRDLEKIMGIPRSEEPALLRVFRHEKAIPQYHVGHGALVEKIRGAEQRHPGFFAGGNSVAGIGVADCIRESSLLAGRVMDFLANR
jgi:oxygen-dependent protoporphyrinogen oxidase